MLNIHFPLCFNQFPFSSALEGRVELLRTNPIHLDEVNHPSGKRILFSWVGFGFLYDIYFLQINVRLSQSHSFLRLYWEYENIRLPLCLPSSPDFLHGAAHYIFFLFEQFLQKFHLQVEVLTIKKINPYIINLLKTVYKKY